jgi:hypothetical protein
VKRPTWQPSTCNTGVSGRESRSNERGRCKTWRLVRACSELSLGDRVRQVRVPILGHRSAAIDAIDVCSRHDSRIRLVECTSQSDRQGICSLVVFPDHV